VIDSTRPRDPPLPADSDQLRQTVRLPQRLRVEVTFQGDTDEFAPTDGVEVRYRVFGLEELRVLAVERTIAWYTEGKGEEDLGVHFFERVVPGGGDPGEDLPDVGGRFTVRLPASPLSYEGVIVKIRWCVRIRLFFSGGRDYVSEQVFFVGRIPPARLPERRGG
jgi:hypothetical protein